MCCKKMSKRGSKVRSICITRDGDEGGIGFLGGPSGLLLDVGERRGRRRRAEHGVELGLDLIVRWLWRVSDSRAVDGRSRLLIPIHHNNLLW